MKRAYWAQRFGQKAVDLVVQQLTQREKPGFDSEVASALPNDLQSILLCSLRLIIDSNSQIRVKLMRLFWPAIVLYLPH